MLNEEFAKMKFNLCLFAATFAAASYGWGLGDALKTIDSVAETVKSVDSAVSGTTESTTDSQNQAETHEDSKSTSAAAPANSTSGSSYAEHQAYAAQHTYNSPNQVSAVPQNQGPTGTTATVSYDSTKQWDIKHECLQQLRGAEISNDDALYFDSWLATEIHNVTDADSEKLYRDTFAEKLEKAKTNFVVYCELCDIYEECRNLAIEINDEQVTEDVKILFFGHSDGTRDLRSSGRVNKGRRSGRGKTVNLPLQSGLTVQSATACRDELLVKKNAKLEEEKAAASRRETELAIKASIKACCDACLSAIKGSKLSYDGQKKRENDVHKFFEGGRQQEKSDGSSDAALTLDAAEEYKGKLIKELDDLAALSTSTDETVLREAIVNEDLASEHRKDIAKQLVSLTTDTQLLMSLYEGDLNRVIEYKDRPLVALRLVDLADGLSDTNVVVSLLDEKSVTDPAKREKLFSRLPNDVRVSYVLHALDWCGVHDWNENKIQAFDDAIVVLKSATDESAVKIVSHIREKFGSYEEKCKDSWTMSWGDEDRAKIQKIIERFPKFDDATLEKLICADETSWSCVSNGISATVAYNVLSGGKAKSGDLEILLAKILPQEKIDIKVYDGAKFATGKKALYDRMSPSMKAEAEKAAEAAYMEVCIQAKSAAKNTFELYGFYLGMPFDDAKKVLAYHFPELKTREAIDGSGKNADHALYIEGQTSPFCFAKTSDQKVWQFNFGKKLLKKWYDFDTQTYMEWATLYGDKTKADMRLKMIEDKTTVYESDMSNSYTVWFHQEAYQYRNDKKSYLLTYFGVEGDFTLEDGIGGDIIKSMAANDFRYVRGDPGSLRVRVVRDK